MGEGRSFICQQNSVNWSSSQGIFILAKMNLRTEQVKSLLFTTNNEKMTVLYMAADLCDVELCKGIFNLAKKSNNRGVKNTLLATDNRKGRSFIWQKFSMNQRYVGE